MRDGGFNGFKFSDSSFIISCLQREYESVLLMNETLQNLVREKLCPEGVWELSDAMKSVLSYHISRLPKKQVTETDTRYPVCAASMLAFLEVFFARHYFQIQNSLISYMLSREFLDILISGVVRFLDIGSGPAVASLAVTDILACILEYFRDLGVMPRDNAVKILYVLNDTSGICLGTGISMLKNYFRVGGKRGSGAIRNQIITIQRAFPDNINQLRRIARNFGIYNIATLSYVVVPLSEDSGLHNLVNGLLKVEELCDPAGRILILQDKFNVSLMRRISKAVGASNQKEELTQQLYPNRNANETYSYSYYSCLYSPNKEMTDMQNYLKGLSPYHAVTFDRAASVFEYVPDFRRFSAKADRDILIETANCID